MDSLVFLRAFLRTPKRIGSVTPSSSVLARLMVDAADIHEGHVVVELGAGTGPFTREIHSRYPDNPFLALEPGAELAAVLRTELPGVAIREGLAQELPQLAREWGYEKVDRVVSGLPWALWSKVLQNDILDNMIRCMNTDAKFVTFTYLHSGVMPAARSFRRELTNRFEVVKTSHVAWRNMPPAYAYICEKPRQ